MKLAPVENRWAEAALAAIFPGSIEQGLDGISAMNIAAYLGDVMGWVPFRAAMGLRLAIWLVALAPLFVLGRLTTIAGLAPAERERVMTVLVASRSYAVRSLVLVLKSFGALLYASDARVRALMQGTGTGTRNIVPLRRKTAHAV
jgi:hypothetical protein